jgi:hypothetical protein
LIVLVLHDDLLCEEAGVDGKFVEGEVLLVRVARLGFFGRADRRSRASIE